MSEQTILNHLSRQGAILTGGHFVYTNGGHGTAYINMRAVAHQSRWLESVGFHLARRLNPYRPDVILGPETLGRTLAGYAALSMQVEAAVWCGMSTDMTGRKSADFSGKLGFHSLLAGKRVVIVDDLLTSGSSIRAVSRAVQLHDGEAVAAAVVARRTADVGTEACEVPKLEVLVEVEGFEQFTPDECATFGPCSKRVPVVERPGHGWSWIESNPGYPSIPRLN